MGYCWSEPALSYRVIISNFRFPSICYPDLYKQCVRALCAIVALSFDHRWLLEESGRQRRRHLLCLGKKNSFSKQDVKCVQEDDLHGALDKTIGPRETFSLGLVSKFQSHLMFSQMYSVIHFGTQTIAFRLSFAWFCYFLFVYFISLENYHFWQDLPKFFYPAGQANLKLPQFF
jgi:hypothetical protein